MKTMQVTVAEFKEIHNFNSQVEANSIINFLKLKGLATEVGKKKRKSGRGKPAIIYEIPQEVTLTLFENSDVPKTVSSEVDVVEIEETEITEVS